MSYDIHFLKPDLGESIENALARSFQESEELNPGRPISEKEALKKRLASALIKNSPQLEQFEFGYKEVAKMFGTTEEEARSRWRHIELNSPKVEMTFRLRSMMTML